MSIAKESPVKPIAEMTAAMDEIIHVIEQETALVRAGRVSEAAKLEAEKASLSQRYYASTGVIKTMMPQLAKDAPESLAQLERKHDEFRALLQINLTVLATAHAVSESIMRGVSDELARKTAPSTYGATGRANAPGPGAAQPLAVSRVL
jgi:hypothetical protein